MHVSFSVSHLRSNFKYVFLSFLLVPCFLFSSLCSPFYSAKLPQDSGSVKKVLAPQRPFQNYQAVRMGGDSAYVRVPHHIKLCVTARYPVSSIFISFE